MYSVLDFESVESIYLYIVRFNSRRISNEIIKVGITSNIEERMCSLRNEYAIEGEYRLLLSLKSNNRIVEHQLLELWRRKYPSNVLRFCINGITKTECFQYGSFFDNEVAEIKSHYLSTSKSPVYTENVVYFAQQEAVLSEMSLAEFDKLDYIDLAHRLCISEQDSLKMIKKQHKWEK